MTLAEWKDIATIAGLALGLFALAKGVVEYVAQGRQKRAEQFFAMRNRLKENPPFKRLLALLENDDPGLASVPIGEKYNLLGFFEELALLLNSGLIRESVAHYMFGYNALLCWKSTSFWGDLNRDSPYWAAFSDFAERMAVVQSRFIFKRRALRF